MSTFGTAFRLEDTPLKGGGERRGRCHSPSTSSRPGRRALVRLGPLAPRRRSLLPSAALTRAQPRRRWALAPNESFSAAAPGAGGEGPGPEGRARGGPGAPRDPRGAAALAAYPRRWAGRAVGAPAVGPAGASAARPAHA